MKRDQFRILFIRKDIGQMLAVQKLFSYETFVHALSGATGSSIALSAFFPFETARTRKQLNEDEKFKTTFEMLKEILQKEGLSGWYQGLLPMISSLWCSNFIYFYAFNGLKNLFDSGTGKPSVVMDLSFAFIAGIINVLLTSPLWVANTRIKVGGVKIKRLGESQTQYVESYSGIWDALHKITKTEGLHALWDGTGPSLLLSTNPAIQFAIYELLKRYLQIICKTKKLSGYLYFMIGALAKMFATITTYPLQIIQSRLRVGLGKGKSAGAIFRTFVQTILMQGISSAFCGLEAKLLQTVFTSALMFLIYEKLSLFIFNLMGLHSVFSEKQH